MINLRLKDLREDLDLTQMDMAIVLNVTQQTYSNYENGKREMPYETMIYLSNFFETSIDYMLGLTNEIEPYKRRKSNKYVIISKY